MIGKAIFIIAPKNHMYHFSHLVGVIAFEFAHGFFQFEKRILLNNVLFFISVGVILIL